MSHTNTEQLIDYWRGLKSSDAAPARADINPADFPKLLPQVFILGRTAPGEFRFRLAGGLLCDLHSIDLRGVDFTELWAKAAQLPLKTALESARRSVQPVKLTAVLQAGPYTAAMEMVLLPLANPDGKPDRFIGLYQPTEPLERLRSQPVSQIALVGFGHGARQADTAPHLRLAVVSGQRVG